MVQKAALISLISIAIGLRGYFFFVSTTHMPTTTDEAIAYFMAREIFQGARPLLFWGTPYQLPVESYLMALFAPLLPNTAVGARIIPALIALVSLLGFFLLLKRNYPRQSVFVGMVLVAIPSAYVLTFQSAYFLPQYTMTLTYAWAIPLLASYALASPRPSSLLLVGIGLLCGLALSNHLLSLPLVSVTLAALGCNRSPRAAMRASALLVPGFVIGLIPYLMTAPHAAAAATTVTGSFPLSIAADRLFSPLMNYNLSTVLGFTVSLFPDFGQWPGRFPSLTPYALGLFWVLLGSTTAVTFVQWILRLRKLKWPTFTPQDIIVGTVWATLCAYALSQRGKEGEFRYLLHVAWYAPFLAASLHAVTTGVLQRAVFAVVVAWMIINLSHASVLFQSWTKEEFTGGVRDMLDISPVIHYLDHKGITACYASFWYVYRFPFETNERIVCSQPYNDRFRGWPLRHKAVVDASERAAYVLTDTPKSRFRPQRFEAMLRDYGLVYQFKRIGKFFIYHDFRFPKIDLSRQLSPSPQFDQMVMKDGSAALHANLPASRRIHRILLSFQDSLPMNSDLRIELTSDGISWTTIHDADMKIRQSEFVLRGNHPVFSDSPTIEIRFPPILAKEIRIAQEPIRAHSIELFEAARAP